MYLEAASLSDLYTSCSGSFLNAGVLNTFVGQARGAGNPALGAVWLNISLFCIGSLCMFVVGLWFLTGPVLLLFGESEELSHHAGYYAKVLALCLPARMVMSQVGKFFAGNGDVKPQVFSALFAAVVNLVFGLVFVLGIPFKNFDGFGFIACPIVTTVTEYASLGYMLLVYCVYLRYHEKYHWTGFYFKDITNSRVSQFLKLYVPQALSISSDYWRVAVIGVFATTISELDVAVFNTSYRIMWMALTMVSSLGASVNIRLSTYIGSGDIKVAKETMRLGLVMMLFSVAGFILLLFFFMRDIASIFSSDTVVVEQFFLVRVPMMCMLFFMALAVFLEQVPVAMGKTKEVFYAGLIGSWFGQVPLSYVFINYVDHSLSSLYWGVSLGYFLTCIALAYIIWSADWQKVVEEAQARSEK